MQTRLFLGLSLAFSAVACSAAPDDEVADLASAAETNVPVVQLAGDVAACPGDYRTHAPVAGRNADYLVAKQSREFYMLFPPGDPTTPHPVLVAFNGTGGDGGSMISSNHLEDFAAKGFIVLAPSSNGNGDVWPVWDALRQPGTENAPNKDLEYFDSLLKCVAGHHAIDKNRVFVSGHSAGGIMANYVLQRRSPLLAGGIVASGVFSLTSPNPPPALDPMFVVVTWGGSNDRYNGADVHFNFVQEASVASKFYDAAPGIGEVNCKGHELGHAWLSSSNDYLANLLLAHPKGHAAVGGALPPMPDTAQATCNDVPFEAPPPPQVTCPASKDDGCHEVCQFVGDCVVENDTLQPALHDQLVQLGFSGDGNMQCGGCITFCDSHGTGADAQVLACFKKRQATAQCGPGVEGVVPLVDAVNECCQGHADSPFCVDTCTILLTHPLAGSFFPTCEEITTTH